MNWKRIGKILFWVGIGLFVWGQVHSFVFAGHYGVWRSASEAGWDWSVFDWFHDFRYAISSSGITWPRLILIGLLLWKAGNAKQIHITNTYNRLEKDD